MGASILTNQPKGPHVTEKRSRWLEVAVMYLSMTALTVIVGWLGNLWTPLASLSTLIVALGFMFLPIELLHRRGEHIQGLGIGGRSDLVDESVLQRAVRSTRQALIITLLVLPVYALGAHLWHGTQGRQINFDTRAFTRWDEGIRGVRRSQLPLGFVALEARADLIKLSWRLSSHERDTRFTLSVDGPYAILRQSRTAKIQTEPPSSKHAFSQVKVHGSRQGWIHIKTQAYALKITAMIDGKPLAPDRLMGGEFNTSLPMTSPGVIEVQRDMSWLWSIFLIQLFLVGLPEEIFYRGYLQTRLDGLVGRDRMIFGVPFNVTSALLCSVLFALAHLVTIHHISRLSVFFPSMLFGWMRRAYHDTLPPAIFHALCNVLAQLMWGLYVLR